MSYLPWILIISFIALLCLIGCRAERAAIVRRRKRLMTRDRFAFSEWCKTIPDVPENVIGITLETISGALQIPSEYLRPTDRFGSELYLIDSFWTLLDDDDTTELVADEIELLFDKRPETDWVDLKHAVIDTCKIVQNAG